MNFLHSISLQSMSLIEREPNIESFIVLDKAYSSDEFVSSKVAQHTFGIL